MKRSKDQVDIMRFDREDEDYEEVPVRRYEEYRQSPRRRPETDRDFEEIPSRRSSAPRSRREQEYYEEERPRRRSSEGERREASRSRRPADYDRGGAPRSRRPADYDRGGAPRSGRSGDRKRPPEEDRYVEEKPRRKKKKGGCCLGGCLIPLLAVVVLLGGAVYFGISMVWGRVQTPGFAPEEVSFNQDLTYRDSEVYRDYELIMLYGVDSRDQDPLKTGALADSNILVVINRKTGAISLTSIYRDTCVQTTGGKFTKLTDVYSEYGVQESLQTINRNFDLQVSRFVTVTWASVARAINSLGGIDITVTGREAKGINKYIDEVILNTGMASEYVSEDLSEEGEVMHLDGVQAVTFCRLRKGLGDDYKRTERQRTVIRATFEKAKRSPVMAGITAYRVLPQIASNISTTELMKLLTGVLNYDLEESYGFPKDLRDNTIYVVPTTLESNDIWLHETLFGNYSYTPSDTVEDISREVLNH